ncbi:MAG: hypothetical protein JWO83_100 [Caulobacteraceae bacterium]|jgi:hypothetical protein|nr:hypothetical protein [Caulobacteraceae bacterium]
MDKLPSRILIWLLVVAALIVVGMSAYFAGGVTEHAARTRDAAAAAQRYGVVESKLRSAQSANQLLLADLWIYRAAAELDERNFGLANKAVAKSVAALNGVKPTEAGIEAAPLAAVRAEAARVNIAVATDLAAQRAQLLRLAADIDALVEASAAMTGAPTIRPGTGATPPSPNPQR